jgi:hypothetical protein
MTFSDPIHSKKLIISAVVSAFTAGLISSGHHLYGAIAYDTMWRAGVSYWILGIVLLLCTMLYIYWSTSNELMGKVALWVFSFGAIIFQSGFTLFECIYSHVLKDLLFFIDISRPTLEQLYPPPAYHLPDNWLFEITGVMQLAGFVSAWFAYRLFQDRPWAQNPGNEAHD